MASTRWLDEREARAWRAMQWMHLRLDAELARQVARDSELSYPEYVLLVALTDRPDGRLRSAELGATIGWEKSRLSHQVSRMVARGLLVKERCETDGRGTVVGVTDEGCRKIEAAAPGHLEAVRRLFIDRLTPEQLDNLAELAETVLAALDDPAELTDDP